MSNGKEKIDWSNLWKNEDWWSCWIGWFILILAIGGQLPAPPKIGTWTSLAQAFPKGAGPTFSSALWFLVTTGVLTLIAGFFMKLDWKKYIPGFIIIFIISYISMIISKQAFMKKWGISYVLFALVIGLLISNLGKVPKFMKEAGQTEFFVKIGLVCMGATIMFSVVLRAGFIGVVQAVLVATTVWFMTYW
ncbi:MAG: putative sulfate exporter family transporter, partial [Phycisphaerales bacterium]|nr:putative sulfate exporter family transporter [Phycisphaerales bacterium]